MANESNNEKKGGCECKIDLCWLTILVLIILGATGHFRKNDCGEKEVDPSTPFLLEWPEEPLDSGRNLTEATEVGLRLDVIEEAEARTENSQMLRGVKDQDALD